jgi:hypothetical protein
MKSRKNPGGNRGLLVRGRLGAAPGFPPVAAWGSIPHVSNQTVSRNTILHRHCYLLAKIEARVARSSVQERRYDRFL